MSEPVKIEYIQICRKDSIKHLPQFENTVRIIYKDNLWFYLRANEEIITYTNDVETKDPIDLIQGLRLAATISRQVENTLILKKETHFYQCEKCNPKSEIVTEKIFFTLGNGWIEVIGDLEKIRSQTYIPLTEVDLLYLNLLERETRKRQNRPGYIYLLKSSSGCYKIGRTINPADRIKTFSVKLPFEVEYLHLVKTDDMVALEKNLHEYFATKRINGEWFNLSVDDVEWIKSLEFMF